MGLSAAAAISIIIIIYSVMPGTATFKQINTANNIMPDSAVQRPSEVMAAVSKAHILPPAPQLGYRKMPTISKSPAVAPPDSYREAVGIGVNLSERSFKTTSSNDSSLRIINKQEEAIIKVPVNQELDLGKRSCQQYTYCIQSDILIFLLLGMKEVR